MDVYHAGYQALVDITQRTSGHVFIVPNTQTSKASMVENLIYKQQLFISPANVLTKPVFKF